MQFKEMEHPCRVTSFLLTPFRSVASMLDFWNRVAGDLTWIEVICITVSIALTLGARWEPDLLQLCACIQWPVPHIGKGQWLWLPVGWGDGGVLVV